jgi:hypothetical protein
MSTRTRILVLMILAMLLGGSTSWVSIRSLLRVSDALREISEHDVELTRTLSEVAAGQLEQAIQLERALRFAGAAPADPVARLAYGAAVEAFDVYAAEMWHALQRGLAVGERAPGGEGPAIVALLADLDHRHNEYATTVRQVFAAFDDGRFADARTLEAVAGRRQAEFDRTLRGALIELSDSGDVRMARVDTERQEAIWLVAGMTAAALALGVLLMARMLYLVRQLGALRGLLPICASCKKIRDDQGYWNGLEAYVEAHSEAEFTHGLCGGCVEQLKVETLRSREPRPEPAGA